MITAKIIIDDEVVTMWAWYCNAFYFNINCWCTEGEEVRAKNFTPLTLWSSSHLLLIERALLVPVVAWWFIHAYSREAITRRSRSFPRWYILHRSISISAVPPGQEKTDHRKRSRRRTRNYQMVIKKERYSDEIPYRTIQGVILGFTA